MDRRRIAEGVLLAIVVLAAHLPGVWNGFVWDDDANVTANPTVLSTAGLARIWADPLANQQYYPLTHTSHWLVVRMFGLAAWAHHATNVLLQLGAAILLWALLRRLLVPGAWVAAAVFGVHPLQVESVSWITERKNVLSMVLLLPAVWLQLRHLGIFESDRERDARDDAGKKSLLCWPAILMFTAALLAKTAVVGAPIAILAIVWWKRARIRRADWIAVVPFLVIGAVLGATTAWLERRHLWVSGSTWSPTLPERVIVAGRTFWFYLGKFCWPADQAFLYPRWEIDAGRILTWGFPLAVVAAFATLAGLAKRIGRGPLAVALVYGAMIAPASGFFYVYFFQFSFVQDHFQYFACVAPAVLVGALAWRLFAQPTLRATCVAAVLVLLTIVSWRQTRLFRDTETLWLDTIAKNPAAWMAQYNLGLARVEAGRIDDGIALYSEALRSNPSCVLAHYNLARALQLRKRDDEALAHYEEAIRLHPQQTAARNNLGLLLMERGRSDDALAHYDAALLADPGFVSARINRANALMSLARAEEALRDYDAVLASGSSVPAEIHLYRGMVLSRMGRHRPAVDAFRQALRIRDDLLPAHEWLAAELHRIGEVDAARLELREFERLGGRPKPALVQLLAQP